MGVTKEDIAEHKHWLGHRNVEPGTLNLKGRPHACLIRTGTTRSLFDTCNGNDKEGPYYPEWHHMRTPFIENLARAGVRPEDVDFVMCSHLHADHIG
ncbi:hypothetical protein AOQ72_16695 [Bradyrhizobium yuanmingense]|uniref:Metallo-beta-lactamase domain-containing protein n=1 Tax=Bradyrhizobium yuanmingense TaxID=108015 RepID=A0A0R3CLY3_9BRAD|nr:MBL fold metallo-hydrolase [Bradyrhizobium yuanmingense]KRP98745.1 hypothetical protein AOQ72_16695 [Bradyrhizobium yuanmingense]